MNPKVFLVGSSLQQAQEIEELITLYGDEWSRVYNELIIKKKLEDSYLKNNNNSNKTTNNTSNNNKTTNKCTCKEVSSNVCS